MRLRKSVWTNPLVTAYAGHHLRSRELALWLSVALSLTAAVALACYAWWEPVSGFLDRSLHTRVFTGRPDRLYLLAVTIGALATLTCGATVSRAALAVTRERERQTLEPLLLTRMRPAAILAGKLALVLLIPLLGTLALLPLLLLAYTMGGLSIPVILAAGGLLGLCHLFVAVIALGISCWCRRGRAALVLGYLLSVVALAVAVIPVVEAGRSPSGSRWEAALRLNPFAALLGVVTRFPEAGSIGAGIGLACLGCLLAALIMFPLGARGLRRV